MMRTPEVYQPALPDPDIREDAGYDKSVTDYLEIRDYTRILYRHRWIVLGIIAVGLLCGVLLNWTTTPIFEAQATVQIDMDLNVLGVDRPLMQLDQRDWMKEFIPTQLGILQSRDVARMAHDELKLSDRSSPGGNDLATKPDRSSTSPSLDAGASQAPSVSDIAAGRTVSMVKDSRLVNIGYRTSDPMLSARVANALARAYVQQNLEFKSKTTGDASDWLIKQVEQQRKLVEESEAVLQRYRSEHGADSLVTDRGGVEQQNIVVQKLGALQAAVTKARTDTIESEAEYRQLTATQANRESLDTVPTIGSNPYIQGLKGELAALQRQQIQASKELGERHPEIIKLQGAVQNAEQKVQTEVANAAGAIRNNFEAARSRERELVAALERQKSEVQALNGKAVEYTTLEREANGNREVLDKLLQRSSEATLARQLQSTSVRIVDQAEVPELPILPRKGRTMTMALVGSGAFALALIFVFEVFNTRVATPQDVKRHLRIPVVGVVPQQPQNGQTTPLLGNGVSAQFAELFQGVRTNLLLSPELAAGRTLLVTSSEPAEGKSVSAANVAVSLARLKQRVLLIDADLRKPGLHEVFGEEQQPGLADVLTGKTTTRDFRKTKVPGLWLMPAGSVSQNPADLLGSARFSKLIDYLRRHFDWIVIDSPPVLAVTDPCLIARVASGVLLVVNCGHTVRGVAAAAIERLDAVGANIVGAVLNRVVLDRRGESYLPYYHRDYKAYYPEQEDTFYPPQVPVASLKGDSSRTTASTLEGWVETRA